MHANVMFLLLSTVQVFEEALYGGRGISTASASRFRVALWCAARAGMSCMPPHWDMRDEDTLTLSTGDYSCAIIRGTYVQPSRRGMDVQQ